MGGKKDWLAAALPTEGRLARRPTVGDLARGDDVACYPSDRLADVAERALAAGKNFCVVIDGRSVVLGRVRVRGSKANPDATVESLMLTGQSTIRPDTSLETVVNTLRKGSVQSTLVTDPGGRLIGTIYLEDVERKLAEGTEGEGRG